MRLLRVVRGYVDIDGEALPAVPHLIPLAAWISGVSAGLSLSGTVAALSACSVRRRGKSLGTGDNDQGDDSQKLFHIVLLFQSVLS